MKTAAIILGAGRSSRFGQNNKLLALLDGKPLIGHVVDLAARAGVDDIVVITGHMAAEVGAAASGSRARLVHNPDFASGMASSIRAGIAALAGDIETVFLMLGDMPLVRADTLARLRKAARHHPEKQAFIPLEGGRRGNPVLFRRAMFPALLSLVGDAGARQVLREMQSQVLELPCDDPGIHADFDTQAVLDGHIRDHTTGPQD